LEIGWLEIVCNEGVFVSSNASLFVYLPALLARFADSEA
jgi:hypothetical protein